MPSFRALVLSGHVRLRKHFWFNKRQLFYYSLAMFNVTKQMVNTTAYTIELWISLHLGGLPGTQEVKLESFSAIVSSDSNASFVLSNLPRASITQ